MAEKHDPYKAKDTGHEWDGIKELKNNPPRWWIICGYLSFAFLAGYFILYPSIPLVSGYTHGLLGWTQIDEYKEGVEAINAVREPFDKKIGKMTVAEILADPEMSRFAQVSSKALFGDNCAACHGSGGQGATGFPVLADDDWLYGGTVEAIHETITGGRQGIMPAYAQLLSRQEIDDLVKFVSTLPSGAIHEAGKAVFLGQTPGAADCVACHGEDAKGIKDVGSANLTDNIWRFSGTEDGIRQTIMNGVNQDGPQTRKAVMPVFGGRLTDNQIKKLAVRVYLLGGGQKG
ncbi:MAG: cytochrome-c oxidase, cbb3-type subunit III [Nitrospinae bacterium]|nr:cytochrome-c oxidase, cbb3-type subunit III [Nitrospinota bacterium]